MKAIATLALISAAYASEDNELFKFDHTRVVSHRNQTQSDHIRHHPIHHNGAHNVTVKPKPLRPVRPVFFNRTKTAQPNNRTRHFELPIHKPMRTFDDEELFFNDEIAENELTVKGPLKVIGPIAGKVADKVIDKILSKLDDDELFLEVPDYELNVLKSILPVAGKVLGKVLTKLDDDELFLEVADHELTGKGPLKVIGPIAGKVADKVIDKILSKLDDDELFLEGADHELNVLKSILPVAGKVLGKVLTKLDDDELFLEVADHELSGQGPLKVIAPIAGKIAGKVLDKVLSKLDDDELFLEDVDHELMSNKMKQFLIANPQYMPPANPEQTEQAAPKKKGGPGKWFGRNKEWIAPIGGKILDKVLSKLDDDELNVLKSILPVAGKVLGKVLTKLDDDELFLEGADHELNVLKSILPVAGKVLGKVLTKLDDDELFLEAADHELAGKGPLKVIAPIAGKVADKVIDKILSKLDDDELFLEVPDHELNVLKSILPVAGKVLGKVLTKLDDDELFAADNELMSKKMKQFLIANPQFMPPVAKPQPQQAAPVADPNAEQPAPTEQPAPVMMPKKKKGGPGKWIGRNKEWIAPIGEKVLDKILSKLDDDELFFEVADHELAGKGPLKVIAPIAGKVADKVIDKILSKLDDDELFLEGADHELNVLKSILPVAGKVLGKVLTKLDDDELFVADHELNVLKSILPVAGKVLGKVLTKLDDDELFLEVADHELSGQGPLKVIAPIAGKIAGKVLDKVLSKLDSEDFSENELFNLGGLIKDGLNIAGDIKKKDFGSLVNHGIQTVKDVKKHDDEFFNVKTKNFLGPL